MSTPILGEIRLFAGNFAPLGWLFCHGQVLTATGSDDAMLLLLRNTYGGDGVTTYGLPDLRGRVPLGFGQGTGLSNYNLGTPGGQETVALTVTQIPGHTHRLQGQNGSGNSADPTGRVPARPAPSGGLYKPGGTDVSMSGDAGPTGSGGNQPHENHQPFLAMNFIIAVAGVFPSQP